MKRVIVHVDRLVLHGFGHADRRAIAASLQRELAGVFADPKFVSAVQSMRDQSTLRADTLRIDAGLKPQRVGEHVARSIGKGLTR